jgi:hypothetical protein
MSRRQKIALAAVDKTEVSVRALGREAFGYPIGSKDVEFVAAVLVGLGFEFDKTDPGVGTFYRRSIAPMMQ